MARNIILHGCHAQTIPKCRVCDEYLVVGVNITQYRIDDRQYVCRDCKSNYQRAWIREHPDYHREWSYRTERRQPMNENKKCASFLGIHVAERVLSYIFKHIQKMPNNNPGYDFICGRGYKVDAKSSCRHHIPHHADGWLFHIRKNQIADYFLCLAFDNRESLTPEHIWLIPVNEINHLITASISETTLDKWQQYEQSIDQVIICCNAIR
jgi:hypothetical protein